MRKRAKHKRYEVEAKPWGICKKCGEAKLPHRICKKHVEICAMKDDEWNEYVASKKS